MKIIVYSLIGAAKIRQLIGIAEYSYYYVLQEFRPLLEQFGEVVTVDDPATQVDALYDAATAAGEQCVFFSFTTPHSAPVGLRCPTVVVFAWEYDTIPDEGWDGDDRFDWAHRLNSIGAAITHSRYTLAALERVAQPHLLSTWLPAPVWDRMQALRAGGLLSRPRKQFTLTVRGSFLESRWIDWREQDRRDELRRRTQREAGKAAAAAVPRAIPVPETEAATVAGPRAVMEAAAAARAARPAPVDASPGSQLAAAPGPEAAPEALPEPAPEPDSEPVDITFAGVVYTALLNPYDGRKNWQLIVEAFCSAFRDVEDATLLIKCSANHLIEFSDGVMEYLRRFAPVQCRIVLLQGYLDDQQYAALVRGSSYYVNASYCEGQCLPLMEFMSYGVPAIAPRTTALADYIRPWNAFVLRAHAEPAAWQHDPRRKFRTRHFRVEHESLEQAFRRSYAVASRRRWRPVYHLLQLGAIFSLRRHCSMKVCFDRLSRFLARLGRTDSVHRP